MNGQIADFIRSQDNMDVDLKRQVFSARFQDIGDWRTFLRTHLNSDVSSRLKAPASTWRVESFHALFIACWIHHPTEKGSYMIDLASLSNGQRAEVNKCRIRPSRALTRKSSVAGFPAMTSCSRVHARPRSAGPA